MLILTLALAADVAELADAQASGACGLKPVEVQLLSSALRAARLVILIPIHSPVSPGKKGLFWPCSGESTSYLTETVQKGR